MTRDALRAAFDRTVIESVRPGAIGLALLYVLFTIAHLALLAEPARTIMATIAVLSAVWLFLIWELLCKRPVPLRWTHPIASVIAGIVLANSAIHLYVTKTPLESINHIILAVGCGCTFLSSFWLSLVLGCTFASWLGVAWVLKGASGHVHIDFGLVSAIVLAAVIHAGRIRIYARLEELHHRDQLRNAELAAALRSAEREIAARKRVETDLQGAREELELRVLDRTQQLAKANEALRGEIEERRRIESALMHSQKMDAIGQLAAGVAHDFNNILTIIQGHTSVMTDLCRANAEQSEMLREISQAAGRAGLLTAQLLLFSRKRVMQPARLDLNDIIQSWTNVLGRLLGEKIMLRFELAPQLPHIDADSAMIEQVLMNLSVNARDAMTDGGALTVRTSTAVLDEAATRRNPEARAGSFVRLSVADTGCGIDSAILSRIFEPFFTTKPEGKGTGLGLSTVYGIVRQHHGWIEVATKPGQGTEFQIFLPATARTDPAPRAAASYSAIPRGTEQILVVEDETGVRQLICKLLRRQGYRVLEAASGIDAVPIWETHWKEIDLLLTDLVMPGGMSGHELARKCLDKKPGLRVVYTSGYSTDLADVGTSLGARIHFLAKPYQFPVLAALIRECLDVQD